MQCLTCTRLTCWGPWCPPLAACRPCPLWPASASAHGARPCPPGLRSTATHNTILDTKKRKQRGCSSVGRASNWHNADTGSIPWCGKEFFSQRQLSVQTLFCSVRTPLCAVACINICVHVKDPVVHVWVWWIMETLKHPACTVGWVAWLCRSWLSPGKATWISHEKNPIGTIQL